MTLKVLVQSVYLLVLLHSQGVKTPIDFFSDRNVHTYCPMKWLFTFSLKRHKMSTSQSIFLTTRTNDRDYEDETISHVRCWQVSLRWRSLQYYSPILKHMIWQSRCCQYYIVWCWHVASMRHYVRRARKMRTNNSRNVRRIKTNKLLTN